MRDLLYRRRRSRVPNAIDDVQPPRPSLQNFTPPKDAGNRRLQACATPTTGSLAISDRRSIDDDCHDHQTPGWPETRS
jgi:hypothetical protein